MQRRTFLRLSAAAAASAAFPLAARAEVPKPYSWDAAPPMSDAGAFMNCSALLTCFVHPVADFGLRLSAEATRVLRRSSRDARS